ncbi:formyltetrahydrofolate-dependent phosphoribosylglycinamide formyltransferase [Lutibacter oricola]|uniref:Phosphoribosylglycinamide formyltransferase n=1 Tax=Lutibacter oricola TaxID=762486 RepID=A0A1H3D085_9FLAO|nr:phosphoribosylglycinamide formyltransferase [Lutibacter oricola]SDX59538.1 formyltetrahydrofolate-dependent phosphoribosylglycinamide formyltransferase [Lutibacter oricola]
MKRIIILASGSGSNAENIIKHFENSNLISVIQILTNKKDAKVLERAKRLKVSGVHFSRDDFYKSDKLVEEFKKNADYIILAGFLWKVPQNLIDAFPNKIINIHPALLPKYGGKGMYGMNVHKSVVENKEKESGITIHYVNENYDEGAIIFQAKVALEPSDSPEDVAQKIHELEYAHFPKVIEEVILQNG